MSEAFRGEFNQKVDGKARVSIPMQFRRILESDDPSCTDGTRPKFVMVYGDGGETGRAFVECYTVTGMARLVARIRRMPPGKMATRVMTRQYITLSQVVEVDDDGRIVLPPKVRERMGLAADDLKDGVEATFAGTLDTFQLWRRDVYDEVAAKQDDFDLDLPEGADLLSLLGDDPEE